MANDDRMTRWQTLNFLASKVCGEAEADLALRGTDFCPACKHPTGPAPLGTCALWPGGCLCVHCRCTLRPPWPSKPPSSPAS
jgi:hypothetical protein